MKKSEWPEPWIYLTEACHMKGVKYNSIARPKDAWKQPNGGKEDGILNGRRAWRPETVRDWITMDDSALAKNYRKAIAFAGEARGG
jgi:hypothetical protein